MRFMYMAGYTDEREFDRFCYTIDLGPIADQINGDVLTGSGSDNELSPSEHTYDLMERIQGPKKLVVYGGGPPRLVVGNLCGCRPEPSYGYRGMAGRAVDQRR